jgi:hypothetical protein
VGPARGDSQNSSRKYPPSMGLKHPMLGPPTAILLRI